jgi:hypothetical protein
MSYNNLTPQAGMTMQYGIKIIFKERDKPNDAVDPVQSIKFENENMIIDNGYGYYSYLVADILTVSFYEL